MSLNNRTFNRVATRFNRLFVRPTRHSADTQGSDQGIYGATQLMIVKMPQGQSVNPIELHDYNANVLMSVDQNGVITSAGLTPTAGTVALAALAHGTNGQLPIAQTGAATAYTTVTGNVTINAAGVTTLDPTLMNYATVNIASANVLTLFTTAVQLVAAPGAGKVIEFVRATITYNHVTTDYTVGAATNLSVKYKDKTGVDVSTTRAVTGFCDGATAYSMFQPLTAQLALDANAVNQPLVLALLVANMTGGDGTLKVNVAYRVHTL